MTVLRRATFDFTPGFAGATGFAVAAVVAAAV